THLMAGDQREPGAPYALQLPQAGLCGIALTAECIFFVSDQQTLYPLLEATNNDDIYGAAWIGIFVGFALFNLAVLGIVGVIKSNRAMLLAYIILMLITYAFETASCITAATHRDFVSICFPMHILARDEGVTRTWDRLMLQHECCGVNGPSDWQNYMSKFRSINSDSEFPWPRQCCVMDIQGIPFNLDGCKLGVSGYYKDKGCYELIAGPMDRHAWGVAWFGFAILCWTYAPYIQTYFYSLAN
uniref:Uroplakin-1b n=1 Tax=Crocodylus porosus TaxID=8502 RepID=A0A7M4E6X8_CROPO